MAEPQHHWEVTVGEAENITSPQGDLDLTSLPPAWMSGGQSNVPGTVGLEHAPPGQVPPGFPPLVEPGTGGNVAQPAAPPPQPPIAQPGPTSYYPPSGPSIPIPTYPQPPAPTQAPIGTTNTATPTVTQATDWRAAVVGAMGTVARDMGNTQFQDWTLHPLDVLALVLSESGGVWTAEKDEGDSAALGRHFFSFGLFQVNELWAPGHYKSAASMIGVNAAGAMPPFPQTKTWTKAQAKAALTAVPGQIWYAMVVLRNFSRLKNTYFTTMKGGEAVATSDPKYVATPAAKQQYADLARELQAEAYRLRIPTTAVALKSYWLASSAAGMLTILRKHGDIRLERFASAWMQEQKRTPA